MLLPRTSAAILLLGMVLLLETAALAAEEPAPAVEYAQGRRIAQLANPAIAESSGMAACRGAAGLFWTHNDSGGRARVYLFDRAGGDLGWLDLAEATALDWEDLASFSLDGKHYLLVADTGNNKLVRTIQTLLLVEEPPIDPARGIRSREVPVLRTIRLRYEDGPHNCEAVGVDPVSREILLVSKEPAAPVYRLPFSLCGEAGSPEAPLVARRIATLGLKRVTAMDVSPDGRRAVVLAGKRAWEFTRRGEESWTAAFSRQPRPISLPKCDQPEAICFGLDGRTLYLTSEGQPTPLFELRAAGSGPPPKSF